MRIAVDFQVVDGLSAAALLGLIPRGCAARGGWLQETLHGLEAFGSVGGILRILFMGVWREEDTEIY